MSKRNRVTDSWVGPCRAAGILECAPQTALKIAAVAGVKTQRLPGQPPRFWRADIERIARETVSEPVPA
jgi:hypothetical protein